MQLIPNLIAGLLLGLILALDAVSVGALIFSASLAEHLSLGVTLAVCSAALLAAVVALGSSFPVASITPSYNAAAILAPMSVSLASLLATQGRTEALLPTFWAAVSGAALLGGCVLFLLGHLGLSRLMRFIPYPVVGGLLAGTGWLIARGSFTIMAGAGLPDMPALFEGDVYARLLTGAVVATLIAVLARTGLRHVLLLPGLILGFIVLAHLVLWVSGTTLQAASAAGWFLQPFSGGQPQDALLLLRLDRVEWGALFVHGGSILTVAVLVPIVVLLNATGLEISLERDADLDRELRVNGVGNLLVGLCGGTIGNLAPGNTRLNVAAGADRRIAGLVAAVVCAGLLFLGADDALGYVPTFVVGGLILAVGMAFLYEWLYRSWFQLGRFDYALVLTILAVVATFGFLEGVGIGILIASLLFVINYSRLDVTRQTQSGSQCQSNVQRTSSAEKVLVEQGESTLVLQLQGYVFFGTANTLLNKVRTRIAQSEQPALRHLLFDFRLVNGVDSSAILSFVRMRQLTAKIGCTLLLSAVLPRVRAQLEQGGVLVEDDARVLVFPDADHGLEWCENRILMSHPGASELLPNLSGQLAALFLDEPRVPDFMAYLERREFARDRTVFRQGDLPDGLYFVESGKVSVLLELPDEQVRRLRTFSGGTLFGEMGVYAGERRSATVRTAEASVLYYLSTQRFEEMERRAPQLAERFGKYIVCLLAERLRHTNLSFGMKG